MRCSERETYDREIRPRRLPDGVREITGLQTPITHGASQLLTTASVRVGPYWSGAETQPFADAAGSSFVRFERFEKFVTGRIKSPERDSLRTRVSDLERKVDHLLALQGVESTEIAYPDLPGVERELAAGREIAAIKEYRKATGAGGLEAVQIVQAMARRREEDSQ